MDALQEAGYAAEKATKSQSFYAKVLRQEAIMWALVAIAEELHTMNGHAEHIARRLRECHCKGYNHECPTCQGSGYLP